MSRDKKAKRLDGRWLVRSERSEQRAKELWETTLLEGGEEVVGGVCIFSHCYLTELGSTASAHSKASLLTLGLW